VKLFAFFFLVIKAKRFGLFTKICFQETRNDNIFAINEIENSFHFIAQLNVLSTHTKSTQMSWSNSKKWNLNFIIN
jgi:hypothetical protein